MLHAAAANGYDASCKLLVEKGVDLNVRDPDGDTPLHLAVFYQNYSVVEQLGTAGCA
jgi:ankyrin repeat protein